MGAETAPQVHVRSLYIVKARSNVEGLSTAAAAFLVRIVEDEAGLQLVLDIIHFRSQQEHAGLGIDQQGDAVVLDHLVVLTLFIGILKRIGQSGAASRAHADPLVLQPVGILGIQVLQPRAVFRPFQEAGGVGFDEDQVDIRAGKTGQRGLAVADGPAVAPDFGCRRCAVVQPQAGGAQVSG